MQASSSLLSSCFLLRRSNESLTDTKDLNQSAIMSQIHAALTCNLDRNILAATLPLLQQSQVDALEWSFDALYRQKDLPEWFEELLQTFAKAGRLLGHGIYFSIFSGRWTQEQQDWLTQLATLSRRFPFDHVTEHFGFMTGADFHKGAPLSVPYTSTTLAIGRDRISRLQEAAACPVGLENLAFAYNIEEVRRQGDFLARLLEPVNGFLILDLHNIYCQLHNFDLSFDKLLETYPLDRVREMHISGGSWEPVSSNPEQQIRRDTHDERVPDEVFNLLTEVLPMVPNLKYVVLEQLGVGLQSEQQQRQFQADFLRMKRIIQTFLEDVQEVQQNAFLGPLPSPATEPVQSLDLHEDQQCLSAILEDSNSLAEAQHNLSQSRLAQSAWQTEGWSPEMLETAMQIAQKWKKGFVSNRLNAD